MKADCVLIDIKVPTFPEKSWIFLVKFPEPEKSWKMSLVLEGP